MTRILRMVMSGFKSFALKTELIFGEEFNVILGPNGSGKSNVLDALCFVLGKGSSKEMRAERAANLIYNGGKKKEPAKQGEVSIFFDNSEKTFPTEEPFVKITRIVKPTGQSTYKINDKTRTRQQILELLAIAKINPDGYNIILQGDIVRFVEMSTDQRRMVIEEIAGISMYEEKKNRALRELERVEGRINEADIVLKERKTYIDELQKERDQAMKFKDAGTKIKQNKASLLHYQTEEKQKELKEKDALTSSRKKDIDKIQAEITKLKKQVEGKQGVIKGLNDQVEQQGEKEQVKVHKEIEQFKVDIATNKTRIGSCENELQRINQRNDQLHKSLADVEEKIARLEKEKTELAQQESSNKKDQSIVDQKIAKFRTDANLDKAGDIEQDIEKLDNLAEEKQKEIQDLRERQQELMREKDRLEYQLQSVDEKIEKVMNVAAEQKEELARLKEMKQDFKRTTLRLNTLLNEDSSLAAQLANARTKLQAANEDIAKLQAQQASLREKISLGTAVQKIIESKSKFPGIEGTVSELGRVKSEYAMALDVSAGARIKSIVVDNEDTASRCIRYLKQNRFGVASFLPLNRVKAEPAKPFPHAGAKGVIGRAIDLINFDAKYNRVFNYVFANTIVVETIDVARRLGIGRYRMVTLEGDLCEISGAMHGGFRRKESHTGFQQKEVGANIAKYEEKAADLEGVVSHLEIKRKGSDEEITKLRQDKAMMEGEIIKLEKSLHLEEGDLDANKILKKELSEKAMGSDKALMELQNKIGAVNKELAALKMKKNDLRSTITELRNPAKLAELNTFEQKRTELKEQLISIQGEMKNITSQIVSILNPEKENIAKILKQQDKEETRFASEIKDLQARIKTQSAELVKKEKDEKVFYNQFKELFTKRNTASDEMQKLETRIIKKEEEIRSSEHRMNAISLDIARLRAEMAGIEHEAKQYEGVKIVNKPIEQLKKEISNAERMVTGMGNVNMKALEIYETVEREYTELHKKKERLSEEKEDVMVMMNEIETKKKDLFMKTFDQIQEHFQRIFSTLTTKGSAELVLEDPDTVFEGGVRIRVKITGRKFLDIRSLSGGEKTLTALAFIFSIQEYDPASFYVLDEVDAALDKRNSVRLAELVKQYADKAQYIMISHNDNIIAEANILYGASMNEHGMTKVVSLKV
ncbi:MAG: chromosome segregation protein SMC [Nanoarchaeota archaeon]